MKIYALLTAMLLNGSMVFGQTDPVIMKIAGRPVSRSEFEYSYNKNNSASVIDKKSIVDYVDLFINYKLKVKAAEDAHLDTLTSFQKEFESYRDQQVRPSFITEAEVEAEAHKIYESERQRIDNNGGMIRPSHILLLLKQNAPAKAAEIVKNRIDSIYNALKKGANFQELAKKYSDDKGSAVQGGLLPWIVKGQTYKEFEDVAYSMKKGEMSKPFSSPAGYHIILMTDKGKFFSYDSLKNNIYRFIEQRGIREQIIDRNLDSIVKTLPEGATRETVLDERASDMSEKDSNLKYLIQEYHDGLLLYEISNRKIWEKAAKDEVGLENYFKRHKKSYAWDEPRFKGIAYHVKDAADVSAVKKSVKGKPFQEWASILRKTFNNDSTIRIRVEKGIFKKGDNAVVDKMVFHVDTAQIKQIKDYPIDAIFGKKLKKGPETYEDVKSKVISDYQDELEKVWIEALRKKYPVEVYQDILATVNKH